MQGSLYYPTDLCDWILSLLQDLRFSRWWRFKSWYSRLWHQVVKW